MDRNTTLMHRICDPVVASRAHDAEFGPRYASKRSASPIAAHTSAWNASAAATGTWAMTTKHPARLLGFLT